MPPATRCRSFFPCPRRAISSRTMGADPHWADRAVLAVGSRAMGMDSPCSRGLPRRGCSVHAARRTSCWRLHGVPLCCLTFELRRPARRDALAPRRTMEPASALRGARAARRVGSPLERGVRPHADSPLTLPRHLSSWPSPSARWLQTPLALAAKPRFLVPGSWFLVLPA
jgi:hypothetical protein